MPNSNTHKSFLLPTLLLTLTVCQLNAQSALFEHRLFTDNADTLKYRQLTSDYSGGTSYPLVIFLHGSGERGNDNEAQLKWGVRNFTKSEVMGNYKPIVIAPQCPNGESWQSLDQQNLLKTDPSKSMRLLLKLIDEVRQTLPVDPNRIYITGLSMGGYGTYDILMRRPNLFAAAVPVCGAGDVSKAKEIAHVPMWVFHGAMDDVVVPEHSHNMFDALNSAGASPGFTQYPEVGHFAWIPAYNDMMMMDWLFKQRKE